MFWNVFFEYIKNVRSVLEIIYFISGIVVALAALLALKQIPLLRRTLSVQSKRDALRLTNEQCRDYMERIIQLQDQLDNEVEGITYFKGWVTKISEQEISATRKTKITDNEWSLYSNSNIKEHIPFNAMEAFSSYFISGAADELIAYHTVGQSFIDQIDEYIPFLLKARKSGHYKNLLELYEIWSKRKKAEDLNARKQVIESELNGIKQSFRVPFGTHNT